MKYLKIFEAKKRVDPLAELIEDIQLVFAYQIDEYPNIVIEKKTGGIVLVSFPKILPETSLDIHDFSNKIITYYTLLENIITGCNQLTNMKEGLQTSTKIWNNSDTSVMVTFWFNTNTTVFKVNPSSVVISKINLLRTLGLDEREWTFGATHDRVYAQRALLGYDAADRTIIHQFTFSFQYKGVHSLEELQRIVEQTSELFLEHFSFIEVVNQWQRQTNITQNYKLITLRMVYKEPLVKKTIILRDLV